jgi:hypothetical protein
MLNLLLSGLFARTPRSNEVMRPKSPGRIVRIAHSGSTFNAGRNAEKRDARERERELRATQVEAARTGFISHAPKRHQSRSTVDMLANRRLRQRGVRS